MSVEISGLRKLQVDLAAAGPVMLDDARGIMEDAGEGVALDGQTLVPVRTGHLRSTISSDLDGDGLGFEAGADASYAAFVEFGTSKMSPQPYIVPAFEVRVPRAIDDLADAGVRALMRR